MSDTTYSAREDSISLNGGESVGVEFNNFNGKEFGNLTYSETRPTDPEVAITLYFGDRSQKTFWFAKRTSSSGKGKGKEKGGT
jgi:hypothetical protein